MIDLHVILDIDQTMIDSMSTQNYLQKKNTLRKPDIEENDISIWIRPGLPEFLNFLVKNAKYISIWTNGTSPWLFHIVNNVVRKYVPQEKINFLLSIDDSTPSVVNGKEIVFIKDIGKALKKYPKKDVSLKNTIIIDDNYYNCAYNKFNSIPIKKFLISDKSTDRKQELNQVTEILKLIKNSDDASITLKNVYDGVNDYNKLFTSVP